MSRSTIAPLWIAVAIVLLAASAPALTGPAAPAKRQPAGAAAAPAADTTIDSCSPAFWPGKKFVLLEKNRMFQEYGYELYASPLFDKEKKASDTAIETKQRRLRYRPFAGRTIMADGARKLASGEYVVTFTTDTLERTVFGRTRGGAIEGIAWAGELLAAKAAWEGKSIHARRASISVFDSVSSAYTTIGVSVLEPLRVAAVRWGVQPLPPQPVWLLVKSKDGSEGIIPVHMSWINVLREKRTPGNPWDAEILDKNPKKAFHWDEYAWDAIERHSIFVGMTAEQVRMSWGEPKSVRLDARSGTAFWQYEGNSLSFKNDTLTAQE